MYYQLHFKGVYHIAARGNTVIKKSKFLAVSLKQKKRKNTLSNNVTLATANFYINRQAFIADE